MRTPASELDFCATFTCLEVAKVGDMVRIDGGPSNWSGVVEWASADTFIVLVGYVAFDYTEKIKAGSRIRFVK